MRAPRGALNAPVPTHESSTRGRPPSVRVAGRPIVASPRHHAPVPGAGDEGLARRPGGADTQARFAKGRPTDLHQVAGRDSVAGRCPLHDDDLEKRQDHRTRVAGRGRGRGRPSRSTHPLNCPGLRTPGTQSGSSRTETNSSTRIPRHYRDLERRRLQSGRPPRGGRPTRLVRLPRLVRVRLPERSRLPPNRNRPAGPGEQGAQDRGRDAGADVGGKPRECPISTDPLPSESRRRWSPGPPGPAPHSEARRL